MQPDDPQHDPLTDELRQMILSTLVDHARPVLANALVRLRLAATEQQPCVAFSEARSVRADLQALLEDLDRLDAVLRDKAR